LKVQATAYGILHPNLVKAVKDKTSTHLIHRLSYLLFHGLKNTLKSKKASDACFQLIVNRKNSRSAQGFHVSSRAPT
jgi:hypothetical protein